MYYYYYNLESVIECVWMLEEVQKTYLTIVVMFELSFTFRFNSSKTIPKFDHPNPATSWKLGSL